MTIDTVWPSVGVEVLRAKSQQKPIVANLLELYARDFSEFHALEVGRDGRFGYRDLPLYWLEPHRIADGGDRGGCVLRLATLAFAASVFAGVFAVNSASA